MPAGMPDSTNTDRHPIAPLAMNVQELITALQSYSPEMRVIVRGYEGGYHDLTSPKETAIRLNVHERDCWYYGPHEDADYSLGNQDGALETALLVT